MKMNKYYFEFCLNNYSGLQYDVISAIDEKNARNILNEKYPNASGIDFIKNKAKIKKLEKNREDYGAYFLEM